MKLKRRRSGQTTEREALSPRAPEGIVQAQGVGPQRSASEEEPSPKKGEEAASGGNPPSAFPEPSPQGKLDLKIPSILLEGDGPPPPPARMPDPRFGGGPAVASAGLDAAEGDLPEAYGTGRLFLAPRDPRCLYVHWDLTSEQMRHYNGRAAGKHLVVRVYLERKDGARVAELHVLPESRHWFIHVARAGAPYVVELGYYSSTRQWHTIAVSEPAATPAEAPRASGTTATFANFDFGTGPRAKESSSQPAPGRGSSQERSGPGGERRVTAPGLQGPAEPWDASAEARRLVEAPPWTAAQEEALAELTGFTVPRREWPGSAGIEELVAGKLVHPVLPAEAVQLGLPLLEEGISNPTGAELGAISSPAGGEVPGQPGFWFNVNAELVIYGATEPDAQVSIGGQPIHLRPDGSFSCRFALPDGNYSLPISAMAAHGDIRRVELRFYRGTRYEGEVGAHPQDPALNPPAPENPG